MSTPTNSELTNARKFPWHWSVYILLGTVTYLYGQSIADKKRSEDNCSSQAKMLNNSIFYWQSKYIERNDQLLYKNNIIDRQQDVINKTDSLARKTFEKPVKQILKNHE
jgi:hypothetical protein